MSEDEIEFVIGSAPNRKESAAGSNTLLSQLGFADRDKRNPRHDLATGYAMSRKGDLAKLIWPDAQDAEFVPEAKITRVDVRNRGPSDFIIGFADGLLAARGKPYMEPTTKELWSTVKQGYETLPGEPCRRQDRYVAVVEVKISPEPIGNCLRQIEAYRAGYQFRCVPAFQVDALLLVDYALSMADIALCTAKNVKTARLGAAFEAYIKANAQAEMVTL